MKVKIGEKMEEFTPFSMTITFECVDDVREMWHRLNVNSCNIIKYSNVNAHSLWNPNESGGFYVFAALDEEMGRRNIDP